ncbi:MAG: methyltransferase domain-containing protein [Clostridiales bacterium]|nr:methyltransferase domain-containing protein [Clostridiales bacterium]
METINSSQQVLYEKYDKNTAAEDIRRYGRILGEYRGRPGLRILDIGGASGNFALALAEYFGGSAEIYVLDSADYPTWLDDAYSSRITFVRASVEELNSVFGGGKKFDLIFANRVFHHFIVRGWRKTLRGMDKVLTDIRGMLADNGTLCVKDHFYNGAVFDSAASFMIYTLTTCKIPAVANVVQKNGAHSAGVGVCFQSRKMWTRRITKNGFVIGDIDARPYKRLSKKKRLLLLCREYSFENIIYAKKSV